MTDRNSSAFAKSGLFASVAVFLFFTFVTYNQIEEDAFIYLRVAGNLAAGYGYVFNRGQAPIEVGSSPLWQLMLVGLYWLPLDPLTGLKVLGILFGVGSIALTQQLARRLLES